MIIRMIVLVFLSAILSACSHSSNNQGQVVGRVAVTNTQALAVIPSSAGNNLYTINTDHSVSAVTYSDTNGRPMTPSLPPTAVYNVNAQYLILCFGGTRELPAEGYLVRKADGSVFSLKTIGPPLFGIYNSLNATNAKTVYSDSRGNIYYMISGGTGYQVVKIDITDPNVLVAEIISPLTDSVMDFTADKDGNVLLLLGGGTVRLRKSNGSLKNFGADTRYHWRAPDGYFYYGGSTIFKLSVDPVSYATSTTTYGSISDTTNIYNGDQSLIEMPDRLILASRSYGVFFELYNPSNSPRRFTPSAGMSTINRTGISDTSYYLAGNNTSSQPVMLKVNPSTDAAAAVLAPDLYDVYEMTVFPADEVIFNALRMSDGRKVIGIIDSLGNVSIIDETLDQQVVVLERIQ